MDFDANCSLVYHYTNRTVEDAIAILRLAAAAFVLPER